MVLMSAMFVHFHYYASMGEYTDLIRVGLIVFGLTLIALSRDILKKRWPGYWAETPHSPPRAREWGRCFGAACKEAGSRLLTPWRIKQP